MLLLLSAELLREPARTSSPRRSRVFTEAAVCALVLAAVGIVYAAMIRPGHIWGDDFAHYIMHAQNIAQGLPYGDTGYIYNPHNPEVGPPSYPPLYPWTLAPIVKFAGIDFTAMKALQVGFLIAFLGITFCYFADELALWQRAAVVILLGFNRYFLDEINALGSDVLFLALVFVFLWMIKRAYRATASPTAWWGIGLAMVMYLAFATRTVGVILPPVLVLHELVRSRWIRLPILLACVTFVALAGAHSIVLASESSYFDQFGVGIWVHVENAARYLSRFIAFWQNGVATPIAVVVGAGLGLLAMTGLALSVKKKIGINEVFCGCYLAIVFAWPTYCDARLLLPVFPIYLCYVFQGWQAVSAKIPTGLASALSAIVLVVALVSEGAYVATASPLVEHGVAGVGQAPAQELFEFVREKTRPEDRFVFVKPRALALFTGRASSAYFLIDTDEPLWSYMDEIHAQYLVVVEDDAPFDMQIDPSLLTYLRQFRDRHATRLRKVYGNSGFSVYRILAEESSPGELHG
jgi:hypothetical protein